MSRFLHLGCHFGAGTKTSSIDLALDRNSQDWARYSASNWVIWTTMSTAQIYALVRGVLSHEDYALVAPINVAERTGLLPQWLWDWMDSRTTSKLTLSDLLAKQQVPYTPAPPSIAQLFGPSPTPPLRPIAPPGKKT